MQLWELWQLWAVMMMIALNPDIFNDTLEVDRNHRVISSDGKANIGLYMISPALISKFGDIVAANRLALQSISLASILSSN